MRADLGALFDDADGELAASGGGELLQTDRRGEAGRPRPDHDDVVLHPLALHRRFRHSGLLVSATAPPFLHVVPAQAGIQGARTVAGPWMPAFAGMTREGSVLIWAFSGHPCSACQDRHGSG